MAKPEKTTAGEEEVMKSIFRRREKPSSLDKVVEKYDRLMLKEKLYQSKLNDEAWNLEKKRKEPFYVR